MNEVVSKRRHVDSRRAADTRRGHMDLLLSVGRRAGNVGALLGSHGLYMRGCLVKELLGRGAGVFWGCLDK
jgi:hypothetical protein